MSRTVTTTCDRCGKPMPPTTPGGWSIVSVNVPGEWEALWDLCPGCHSLVLAELQRLRRGPTP